VCGAIALSAHPFAKTGEGAARVRIVKDETRHREAFRRNETLDILILPAGFAAGDSESSVAGSSRNKEIERQRFAEKLSSLGG
jgi:enhancing lycopene biosynthesis protein 2